MFVVQADEKNAFDQKGLEYALWESYGIRSHRISFTEIQEKLVLSAENRRLCLKQEGEEISVIYYRAGYGPEDYQSEKEWQSREMLERSKAIKCPTIIAQLAGSKKVQQILSESNQVEHFLGHGAAAIRQTFVAMHSIDSSPAGQYAVKLAFNNPEKYVLKPQREGGGNNIYRKEIPRFLESIPESHWPGYILMELIVTAPIDNAIVRDGQIVPTSVISELGIYGAILWDDKGKILYNEEAGHLLRTKMGRR